MACDMLASATAWTMISVAQQATGGGVPISGAGSGEFGWTRADLAEVDEYRQAAAGMCLGFFIDANEKMMR